jgi:hypothetical protein
MKDVLHLLNETKEINVKPSVLKGTVRELEMNELGLVSGGQEVIINTSTHSGGDCYHYDDCRD